MMRKNSDRKGAKRFTLDFDTDPVRIWFPDGTVMMGNRVLVAGPDAIVKGDRFVGWKWAQSAPQGK